VTEEIRDRINWWKLQAAKQDDPFVRFFMFYMCLDAWMSEESQAEHDSDKLKWLINKDNALKEFWTTTPHKTVPLNGLVGVGEVENMHPKHRGKIVRLIDADDFGQVIRFIYQIRCNLFHGGKSPVNTKDRALTRWSANILENWITWTLLKTR
jgi:hypothetical protein